MARLIADLEDAKEEARVISELYISDPDKAGQYVLTLRQESYQAGGQDACDTLTHFKEPRRTKFREGLADG